MAKVKTKRIPKAQNLNEFAKTITEFEKGHSQVNIAQVKEVLTSIGAILGGMRPEDAMALVARLIEKAKK